MDDDVVLQALGADLERDDPRLAALLSGEDAPRLRSRHRSAWLLLAVPVLGGLLLLPVTTAVGIVVMLLVVAAPLVGLLCEPGPDGGIVPHSG